MPATTRRPKMPYKHFPLFAHLNGQWCKKIKGRLHYFGTWNNPDAALAQYLAERDDLQAGRTPQRNSDGVAVGYLVNTYLERSEARVDAGELPAVSLADYIDIGKPIVADLGRTSDLEQLRPTEFAGFRKAMSNRYGPARLSKIVTVTRQIIKWAYESELFDHEPRFGPEFKAAGSSRVR